MRYVSLDSVALRGATYIIPPLALVALSVLSLIIGSIRIPASTTFRIVGSQIPGISSYIHATWPRAYYIIVVYLREPEVIGSLVVGASLGVGGAVIQSVFRNPITEPYIIGISSGAALGAVIAFVSGITVFGIYSLQVLAFVFSIAVVSAVYLFSFRGGRAPPTYLLLAGIAISLFTSSMVALLLYTRPALENEAYFWLLGSINGITWGELRPVTVVVVLCMAAAFSMNRSLDALQLGDQHAHSIGVRVERVRATAIAVTTLSVSAVVSVSGLIGFVGLIVPHISRILYGGTNSKVIPYSAVFGAMFLLVAEDVSKMVLPGEVIPIGIVTGIVGVPFFLYLVRRVVHGTAR